MSNLEKIEEMIKNDPTLQEKLAAETKRLTESGKDDLREITAEATKAVFGIELTGEELDALPVKPEKMNLDELDNVAGGVSFDSVMEIVDIVGGGIDGAVKGTLSPFPIGVIVRAYMGVRDRMDDHYKEHGPVLRVDN